MEIVRDVVTASAKRLKAVIGLDATLKALNANRVWQFVYSSGFFHARLRMRAMRGAIFRQEKRARTAKARSPPLPTLSSEP